MVLKSTQGGDFPCTGDIQLTPQSEGRHTYLVSIPANATRESVFGHLKFPHREWGTNIGPLAPDSLREEFLFYPLSATCF